MKIEKVIEKQLSTKRMKFIVEDLYKRGRLKSKDSKLLYEYFNNNASKSDILKYLGNHIYESMIDNDIKQNIIIFMNSVFEGNIVYDDLSNIQSRIENLEKDPHKIHKLNESLVEFTSNITPYNRSTIYARQFIAPLMENLNDLFTVKSVKIKEAIINKTIISCGSDNEDSILEEGTVVQVIKSNNGVGQILLGSTYHLINESCYTVVSSTPDDAEQILPIQDYIYNYDGADLKFSGIEVVDNITYYLFVPLHGDSNPLTLEPFELPELKENDIHWKSQYHNSEKFESYIDSTLNLNIKKNNDELINLKDISYHFTNNSDITIKSDGTNWYLYDKTNDISWIFDPMDIVKSINQYGNCVVDYSVKKESDFISNVVVESKDIEKNPYIIVDNKKCKVESYSPNGVFYIDENNKTNLALDTRYTFILESTQLNKKKIDDVDFTILYGSKDDDFDFCTFLPSTNIDLDKVLKNQESYVDSLKKFLKDKSIDAYYNKKSDAAGITFNIPKEQKLEFDRLTESTDQPIDQNYELRFISDRDEFDKKLSNFLVVERPNDKFQMITDYMCGKTGILIGDWDSDSDTGHIIDDSFINESVNINKMHDILYDKFDETLLKIAYSFLFKKYPTGLSKEDISKEIINYFINHTDDENSYNLIFSAYENVNELSDVQSRMDYFGLLNKV